MTDAELVTFAQEFREWILDGAPSDMMCEVVSWPLAGLLNFHGIECKTVETDLGEMNHVWIKLKDGRALDATADQFNKLFSKNYPPIYLGPPLGFHCDPEATPDA